MQLPCQNRSLVDLYEEIVNSGYHSAIRFDRRPIVKVNLNAQDPFLLSADMHPILGCVQ